MAKVCPQTPTSTPSMTSKRETFTLWMKSLVCHSNGCTVFDSRGKVVYRVDNYEKKCSNEVYLMDLKGKVLFTIRRKRFGVLGRWNGYKCGSYMGNKERPWFQVRKRYRLLQGDSACQVIVGCYNSNASSYRIVRLAAKEAFKIVDTDGKLVAEVKQKQSCTGVVLGEDVLSLTVEPCIDHSLIMAIVIVYALINHKM